MALVIFSARTGRIRRIISDETLTDSQLLVRHPPGPGEQAKLNFPDPALPNRLGASVEEIQRELSLLTGLTPSGDRYVTVDENGIVDHVLLADPDCGDSIENRTLILHETAMLGDRLD